MVDLSNLVVAPPPFYNLPLPSRILRLPEVITRVGLCRASIYLHMGKGLFPKAVTLGPRSVGWLESEIDAWLAVRIEARRMPKK